jgi:hypothetical protein
VLEVRFQGGDRGGREDEEEGRQGQGLITVSTALATAPRPRVRPSQAQEKASRRCQGEGCGRPFVAGPFAKWGPCCRWKQRGRRKSLLPWTAEADEVLCERYDSRVRGRVGELARSLGRRPWEIKRRACELGIAFPRAAWKDWTPEEVALLETNAGVRHVNWIAKRLGRSLTSVILKLKRLHLSRRIREGYTMRELELALGLDHRKIARLVDEGKLKPAHRSEHPRERWIFTNRDVLAFLRRHPTAFRLDRVDQLWFLDLVFNGRVGQGTENPKEAPRAL